MQKIFLMTEDSKFTRESYRNIQLGSRNWKSGEERTFFFLNTRDGFSVE